jgi:carboxylesterase type B
MIGQIKISSLVAAAFALTIPSVKSLPASVPAPTVTIKNGTYSGVYSPEYQQDFFLGMPFAQPPLGPLRFANPVSLNSTWSGVRNATEYSVWCPGYNQDVGYVGGEDCLTINVVRPLGYEDQELPVAAWIFGGGFFAVSREHTVETVVKGR